jgi:2-oxoglutarate ferredoxin oxidoreductase subunit beta
VQEAIDLTTLTFGLAECYRTIVTVLLDGIIGQMMAPTSLPGMRTTSSPTGRDVHLMGYPLKICELIAQIDGATYVARRSLHSPGEIRKAKKAIRQAFENRTDGVGFSLVELLSSCPSNWAMAPDSRC